MPRLYIKTLGCKVNAYDSHALINRFKDEGYELVDEPGAADVAVVNTCSVTANADREARYLARRLRREAPEAVLLYTGCYAQTDSAKLAAMDEIDFVVPNEAKDRLLDVAREGAKLKRTGVRPESKLPEGVSVVANNRQAHFKSALTVFDRADVDGNTRVFLKIQDGCNGFCSYCLIPYARGASRSVAPERVVDEVARLARAGAPEIVLTGIHIGDYGRDLDACGGDAHPIVTLLAQLFALPGDFRVRISSLEPSELTEELVALLAAHRARVCDHLHLPLQSGCDRILKLMRRTYDKAGYARAVAQFRAAFPEASIGADVIPGFPGETDAEFEETLEFIKGLELSYLHVFPYSLRPNTAAARMPGHLDGAVVKARAARLRALSEELAGAYARRFVGRTLPVVWEKDQDEQGRRLGMTANYLQVAATGELQPRAGERTAASLKGFGTGGRLVARPLDVCQGVSF